jgi:hypothetical protein
MGTKAPRNTKGGQAPDGKISFMRRYSNVFTLLYDDVLKLRKNIPVDVSSILYDEGKENEAAQRI